MKRFTMNIIARSMEISIRRIRPTIIRRVARTPQEEVSVKDVKIRWVSKKTTFVLFMKIRNLVYQNFCSFPIILVEVNKFTFILFGCSLVQNFLPVFFTNIKKTKSQNSKMLKKIERITQTSRKYGRN